jgi:nitric oxide reductase activation protein
VCYERIGYALRISAEKRLRKNSRKRLLAG